MVGGDGRDGIDIDDGGEGGGVDVVCSFVGVQWVLKVRGSAEWKDVGVKLCVRTSGSHRLRQVVTTCRNLS